MAISPLVQEIHQAREAYALRYNNDLKALCDDARVRQASNGHEIALLSPRLIEPTPSPSRREA